MTPHTTLIIRGDNPLDTALDVATKLTSAFSEAGGVVEEIYTTREIRAGKTQAFLTVTLAADPLNVLQQLQTLNGFAVSCRKSTHEIDISCLK